MIFHYFMIKPDVRKIILILAIAISICGLLPFPYIHAQSDSSPKKDNLNDSGVPGPAGLSNVSNNNTGVPGPAGLSNVSNNNTGVPGPTGLSNVSNNNTGVPGPTGLSNVSNNNTGVLGPGPLETSLATTTTTTSTFSSTKGGFHIYTTITNTTTVSPVQR